MKKFWLLLSLVLWLAACARMVSGLDEDYYEEVTAEGSQGSILFSHNINGETQPCGCNKFPLGGLEQVAGHFHQVTTSMPVIYVDTGDLFFPSTIVPENLKASHEYTANTLLEAAHRFQLKFFVPGDQDFALGKKWLADVSQTAKFTFLIANLREGSGIKAKKWARVKVGRKKIVFIGVTDPELLSNDVSVFFSSPEVAIQEALKAADPSDNELVVLLSHSGLERDKKFAQLFPRLNWIIGAHTQSFTQRSIDEGATQLVQVLSRNHFIGQILFGLGAKDRETSFKLLETREEMAKAVTPNPMTDFLLKWKEGVAKIQATEQQTQTNKLLAADPLPTFNSCLECHSKQTQFWQTTAHGSAWITLVNKKSDNDASCVGCHSVGWQSPQGFMTTTDRVRFEGEPNAEKLAEYSQALHAGFAEVKSVRALSPAQRKLKSQSQLKLMKTFNVTHEFGNVQCLNCHDKKRDHPFDGSLTSDYQDITTKCLQCHTKDQSPSWYNGGTPNKTVVQKALKQVSCPSGK